LIKHQSKVILLRDGKDRLPSQALARELPALHCTICALALSQPEPSFFCIMLSPDGAIKLLDSCTSARTVFS
jgi:hypothetical protein